LSISKYQRYDALRVRQPFYDFLLKGQYDGIIRSDVEHKTLSSIGLSLVHNLVEEQLTGNIDLTEERIEKTLLFTWNLTAKEVN
jgi:two-component sensor histidine kinase